MCIFALASRHCSHDARLSDDKGDQFLIAAKGILVKEIGSSKPTISTIQGLLILGCRQCAVGNISEGWLFSGMVNFLLTSAYTADSYFPRRFVWWQTSAFTLTVKSFPSTRDWRPRISKRGKDWLSLLTCGTRHWVWHLEDPQVSPKWRYLWMIYVSTLETCISISDRQY